MSSTTTTTTALLQAQTAQLKAVLATTTQALHAIQPRIRTAQDRLTELAIVKDTTLLQLLDKAARLVQNASLPPHVPPLIHTTLDTLQTHLDTLLAAIHTLAEGWAARCAQGETTRQLLITESARLAPAIRGNTAEEAYLDELARLCDALEGLDPESTDLDSWIAGLDVEPSHISDTLARAWNADQSALIAQYEASLTPILEALDALLDPLTHIHDALYRLAVHVGEVEALLEAFGEELEEEGPLPPTNTPLPTDMGLEDKLKALLEKYKNARPPSAPPLVLLTTQDLILELQALEQQYAALPSTERSWALDTLCTASSITLPPYLSTTTPLPLPHPPQLATLVAQTRQRASELQSAATELESAVEITFSNPKNIKRLGGFVDRWCTPNSSIA